MDYRKLVSLAFVIGSLLVSARVPAAASPGSDAFATVSTFTDDFNKGNVKGALALCTPSAAVIDEFPPHTWTSCAAWASALDAAAKAAGDTDQVVKLRTPWHTDVTGSVAYVVVPTDYTYKEHGKPMAEHGSVWTLVLKKTAAGWRITSWCWAKH